jgi:lactoylglutathione lyase
MAGAGRPPPGPGFGVRAQGADCDILPALEDRVKIEHVAIWCQDLEGLRQFYETYLGARSNPKYVNQAKGFESYFLSFESGARMELMRMPWILEAREDSFRQSTGLAHLAFSVGSEERVEALTAALSAAGYEVLDGPRRTGDGYYESVVLDPEKNRIELTA